MCKHVAAALYGVAVRLDEKPELFFTLRGIDVNSFVVSVAKEESEKLLQKSTIESSRVLFSEEAGDDMAELFGIALDSTAENAALEPEQGEKKTRKTGKTVKKKVIDSLPVSCNRFVKNLLNRFPLMIQLAGQPVSMQSSGNSRRFILKNGMKAACAQSEKH
ncbi:MAG TPA: hypothetical protein VHO70_24335 [Chitinispirillaceae bacterium]|nr:hypothetical protein [Chitinispirillaceae bacterium]